MPSLVEGFLSYARNAIYECSVFVKDMDNLQAMCDPLQSDNVDLLKNDIDAFVNRNKVGFCNTYKGGASNENITQHLVTTLNRCLSLLAACSLHSELDADNSKKLLKKSIQLCSASIKALSKMIEDIIPGISVLKGLQKFASDGLEKIHCFYETTKESSSAIEIESSQLVKLKGIQRVLFGGRVEEFNCNSKKLVLEARKKRGWKCRADSVLHASFN